MTRVPAAGRRMAVVFLAGILTGCQAGDGSGASPQTTAAPLTTATQVPTSTSTPARASITEYAVPAGSRPHDVAVAGGGRVWYTAQGSGELGRLDTASGRVTEIPLGGGSRPHGVIVGPDGAAWVTDGGLNAIVRVDSSTLALRRFNLPADRPAADLNTAVFDKQGRLWFTGQAGVYGRLDPPRAVVEVFDAPGGRGPYGITVTPNGDVYYASLAGHHIARIDPVSAAATVLRPPTPDQGSRRVWADSQGRVWSSQWEAGQVAVYDPATDRWKEWRLPGERPQAYAVYVDGRDRVWLSDFGRDAFVRFDPDTEQFALFALPSKPANVRQIHGRGDEVWGAESAADKLVVVRG